MLKVLSIFLSIFILVVIWFFWYYWVFNNTKIYIIESWWDYFIYKNIKWSYNKDEDTDDIYNTLLNEDNIKTYKFAWIYYPNWEANKNVDSEIWCVLEKKDENKIDELKNKYKVKLFPTEKYITTDFSIRWQLSYILWRWKIYPKLNQFAKENWYLESTPVIEIYDIPNEKIIYRKVIIKKD